MFITVKIAFIFTVSTIIPNITETEVGGKNSNMGKGVRLSLCSCQVAHLSRAYPGVFSMKQPGNIPTSPWI